MTKLSKEQRVEAQQVFDSQGQCGSCGGLHSRACPRVKRIHQRFSETKGLQSRELIETEIEYFEHGKWPTEDIIFPEDAYEDSDDDSAG